VACFRISEVGAIGAPFNVCPERVCGLKSVKMLTSCLRRICGSHNDDCDECCFLVCDAVQFGGSPTFRRYLVAPSSGSKYESTKVARRRRRTRRFSVGCETPWRPSKICISLFVSRCYQWTVGARSVKFGRDNKHIWKVFTAAVTDMEAVGMFQVVSFRDLYLRKRRAEMDK
jgi:hypothetical protein